MPIVKSNFKAHFGFRSGFIATVYSGLIRRLKIKQFRERITLRDDDFIDLDWSYSPTPSKSVIILFHGLEGHGQRPYITGAALHFNEQNIDAICVNFPLL